MIAPGEYLSFLSVDKWTMIFSLINTLILYKIIKKFLFNPVNKMINDRKLEIKKDYDEVQKALADANDLKKSYEIKMKNSIKEATEIINKAKNEATEKYYEVVNSAKDRADDLIKKANQDLELKSKKAVNDIKDEVADMVIVLASKVIEKEIKKDEHKKIIDNFFTEVNVK